MRNHAKLLTNFLAFFVFVSFVQAQKINNILTKEQQKEGWTLLFNGKDYSGWHRYGTDSVGSAWKIEDECMFLDASDKLDWQTKNGGDIVSQKAYQNFHLQIEWKIAQGGNSGIIFLVQDEPKKYDYVWKTGLEMQILDNDGHSDAKIPKHRAGDLYDLIASSSEPVRQAGEWNQAEIVLLHDTLDYYLNGVHIVHTILHTHQWDSLVKASKFGSFPKWGTFQKGHLSLQDHGNKVWYRNIRIRELSL